MKNLLKVFITVLLVALCFVVSAAQQPYPKFNKYIQTVDYDQVYCKSDFTPEGQALIKHYFKYAVSICGDELDMLTVDPKMREAFRYYLKQANEGNGKAAYIVGWAMMMNLGVDPQDVSNTKIIESFKKSADLGYVPGMAVYAGLYKRGSLYSITHIKEVDAEKYKLYLKAAKNGSFVAYTFLINYYAHKKNYTKARYWINKARQADYFNRPELILNEVGYYFGGNVLPENPSKALQLVKKILTYKNAGIKTIQASLRIAGICYSSGLGTKKDLKQAYYYYRRAALLNDGYSQNKLGGMCYSGLGVKQDKTKANYWYCAAYQHEYMPARKCKTNMNHKPALKEKT